MTKKIFLGVLAFLVAIQFFRIDQDSLALDSSTDFIRIYAPPNDVAAILKTSCYDCHSYETNYPWYSNVAPVSWWVGHHIEEGREELNFSEWTKYSPKKAQHKLKEMIEEIHERKMPLPSYTWMHPESNLSPEQREILTQWIESISATKVTE